MSLVCSFVCALGVVNSQFHTDNMWALSEEGDQGKTHSEQIASLKFNPALKWYSHGVLIGRGKWEFDNICSLNYLDVTSQNVIKAKLLLIAGYLRLLADNTAERNATDTSWYLCTSSSSFSALTKASKQPESVGVNATDSRLDKIRKTATVPIRLTSSGVYEHTRST